MNTVLLLGRTGQVGWELERSLQPLGRVVACARSEADLSRPETLRALVERVRPDVIVNAAAYTAVDAAEQEEDLAYRINADGPAVLAEAARELNAWLVHYSTDYVFDGTRGPYSETDATRPLNAYGRTKRAGEEAIAAAGCKHVILRTSWVYGARGKNFLNTMLRLAREQEVLRVVDDQIGAPTWSRTIADVTAAILTRLDERRFSPDMSGIYHLASQGETSWYGFARLIIEETRSLRESSPRIEAISTEAYPLPAQRPRDSRLDCRKLTEIFRLTFPTWQDAARLCFKDSLVK
ncbi:MAG: dTDP-4-dehydrorhamnose reductase [Gammaproteobacteria bacterium]|nr:dTDP-4-dehydrorhamnose reductase [Gammaproteobacteria bacterium]